MRYDVEALNKAADYAAEQGFYREEDAIRCALNESERLRSALDESVKLQSHYAELLNGWDGGMRITFHSSDEWLERLAKLKEDSRA